MRINSQPSAATLQQHQLNCFFFFCFFFFFFWYFVARDKVSGTLHNTGQSLVFRPESGPKKSLAVNVTAGPLAYRYQIEEVFLHYGTENSHGSEHRIHGHAFPAEVSLYLPTHPHAPGP